MYYSNESGAAEAVSLLRTTRSLWFLVLSTNDRPPKDELMATAPHRGHTTKYHSHKARQIGEGDQHAQSPLQRRDREKSGQWKSACRLYTFQL